jgi:hypothetical protein
VDISPLAAARALVDVRRAPEPATSRVAQAREGVGIPLASYLEKTAGMPSMTSRPDDPTLRPKRGGGYEFTGTGFDATIDRDGTVHFADKYVAAELKLVPVVRDDGSATTWFFQVHYDLEAWLEHLMGNDLHRSERRWFLERTAALRDRLAREAFKRALERARVSLQRSLRAVWNDPRRTLEQKKRETFEHWDMNADDDIGALGRNVVEAFVRERCPVGSACEFRAEDCSRFNQLRKSRVPFQPYP